MLVAADEMPVGRDGIDQATVEKHHMWAVLGHASVFQRQVDQASDEGLHVNPWQRSTACRQLIPDNPPPGFVNDLVTATP